MYNLSLHLSGSKETAESLIKQTFDLCAEAGSGLDDLTIWKTFCSYFLDEFSATNNHPKSKTDRTDLEAKLQDAILRLPPEERLVLLLRETARLDCKEISLYTGNSKARVSAIYARGRECLLQELNETALLPENPIKVEEKGAHCPGG
ncbi:MAG: sigma factor-like helix-turn-helix DNA-binding protein [Bacillota bacterium]|nr:sigma factor-like helix-turn-helix DNA-binding protein [Bacillota bacterium]